jgi:hypothetical protein
MLTYNAILKEIKDIPIDKLEELYSYIHSLSTKVKKTDTLRKKILSFGGAFSDMSEKDYNDYLKEIQDSKTTLFNRKFN